MTKLTSTGMLVYSTYLGGSATDQGFGIAVDSAGNAYVTGVTGSADFPSMNPLPPPNNNLQGPTDAFVTKLNSAGSALLYSTFLGGAGSDQGNAIAVDSSLNAYVTGFTNSTNFPAPGTPLQSAYAGGGDAFVTKLNAAGSALVYSTYLGGTHADSGNAIAVDSSGNAHVAGQTFSADFPMASSFETGFATSDGFVAKLNPAGSALLYSSFLGGGGNDAVSGIALDSSGNNAYVVGSTDSTDFPTLAGSFRTSAPGGTNAFVAEISPNSAPAVSLSKMSLNFSDQSVGTISASQPILLRNMGSASLNVASIAATGDFAETDNCLGGVSGGSNCTINITFSPSTRGARPGSVTITDNALPSTQTITLNGSGITPNVILSTNSLTFGSQALGTSGPSQAVTLTNTGSDPLGINGISISGDFAETNNCPASLAANGGNCTITVTFTPTAALTRTGKLAITDNAAGSPHIVQLTGTGVGPAAALSTTSLTFIEQPVNTTSGPEIVTLTNAGNAPLTISGIGATGNFAHTNNCGSGLAAGNSCAVNITFSPKATGTTFGTVTIADNAPGNPHVVNLTGNAILGPAPEAFLSSSTVPLGSQPVGTASSAQPFTLTNTGNAALSITSIAVAGDFSQTNTCGTRVAAGAMCAINITFTPTAVGQRTGTVTITDNATGSPHSASLTGTGTDFALSATAPTATVTAGQSASYNFSVTPLSGYNQTVSFSCTGAPSTASCTVNPASMTLDGLTPANVKVTVATTTRSVSPPNVRGPRVVLPLWAGARWILVLLALAMLAAIRRRLAVRPVWLVLAIILLTLLWGACGVGSQKVTGTLAGSYALTVTATSGTLSHQLNLVLNVN